MYVKVSIYRECNSACQLEVIRPRNPVMDIKLVRSKLKVPREDKTSMSSLPTPNESESDRSLGKPSNLPVDIAAIEIQAGEAFVHREGIARLNIAVWQERAQPPADINPDQKLLKT